MLTLIYGSSGAGKTAHLIDCIRRDIQTGTRCFLLVPEQQAYISERDLPEQLPPNAGLYFEVVHFSRLADDVFRRYGGLLSSYADSGIRAILMWDTLRTVAPLLQRYLPRADGDSTLSEQMLGSIAELQASGVEPGALEEAAARLEADSPLRKKLSDLALIQATYHQKLEECFGSDPTDKLLRLAETLRSHPYFSGSHLYIDSFTSFTVPEYTVLREILRQADVTVSLCTDALPSALPHFEGVSDTARRLLKLANEADTEHQTHRLSRKLCPLPELGVLESELWNFSCNRSPLPHPADPSGPVRLTVAANLYEEAEAAACHISELVQSGMHYGDIAVVVRDTETVRGVLDTALERAGIPYFLSERTELASKPIFRLMLSALRAVSRGYRQNDIITLLKTGLFGISLSDSARFEEYCETWHIGGKRFFDEIWSMNPDGLSTERSERGNEILAAANRVRETLMRPLGLLAADLRRSPRLIDRCRALYDYLTRAEIPKHLSEMAATELSEGRVREAGESLRLFRLITDMLTSLSRLLPDAETSVEEFFGLISLFLSHADLGSVPTSHDCVIIGSADTLRVENVRASLILGLCEGEFPRADREDGLLTESDKEALEELGICLHSRAASRFSEELFFVYRALTKPSERLYLSTIARQTDGSARTPSLAFSRVGTLLGLEAEHFDADQIHALAGVVAPEAIPSLSLPPNRSPITLHLSQSKIQAFVLCPYRYYSTYRLGLREPKDSTPSYADDGTFLHDVFEHFLRASLDENGQLRLPPEDRIEAIADDIITAYLAEVCPFPPGEMSGRLRHLYARLRKLALLMLYDILAEIRASRFVPSRFEQVIGSREEDGLPAPRLTLSDGSTVLLSGKVDRIDLYRDGERVFVRVVDYKSGKHTFSLDEVRSGMDIQLVLYLFAVLQASPTLHPAGAAYLYAASDGGKTEILRSGFFSDDPSLRAAADATPEGRYTKRLLSRSEEELKALSDEMQSAVCRVAERILSGEAEKTPSEDACRFCPVRSFCDRCHPNG